MARKKSKNPAITRRRFIGTTSAGAAALIAGCHKGTERPEPAESIVDTTIHHVKIHPAIGVARVGNSLDESFIGPEVVSPPLTQEKASRDASGALKRQAARFRIYGYNKGGQVVREITAAEATIEWKVEVKNKKSEWYRFLAAQDLPPEQANTLIAPRRNPLVIGAARRVLAIAPGEKTVSGPGQSALLDGGKFFDTEVPLGELRTDADGRLLFLGGKGQADSPFTPKPPLFKTEEPDTFNNADGWFDDICDGPVDATVTFKGREPLPAQGAWVVVAPPNYAPDVIGWRTMYDMLVDLYMEQGLLDEPTTTSFQKDILPILERMSGLSWVNAGFFERFGKGSPKEHTDFTDPDFLRKLSHKPGLGEMDEHAALRRDIVSHFRSPEPANTDRTKWPYIYGDAFGSFDQSPRVNLAPSKQRFAHLERWMNGDFVSDYDPNATAPTSLDDVPLAERPAMLDKAALHYCLADAFHPGCELTWPMRSITMYETAEPLQMFRIKRRTEAERDYGAHLTTEDFAAEDGPLGPQGPGDLTRWMAIPWHGDTVFCRSGYDPLFHPFLPTFWPARVPNQVLSEQDYQVIKNSNDPAEITAAFQRREHWVRALTGSVEDQMKTMVGGFAAMGVVEARPALDKPGLPKVLFVETLPPKAQEKDNERRALHALALEAAPATPLTEEQRKIEAAGWKSEAEFLEFSRIRARRR